MICPQCSNHIDCQSLIGSCKVLVNKIGKKFRIEDIYKEQIDLETGKKIIKIEETRKKLEKFAKRPKCKAYCQCCSDYFINLVIIIELELNK